MARYRPDTRFNPQPQCAPPMELPADDFSAFLWQSLHYVEPKTRLLIIRLVHEGISTALIYRWYCRYKFFNDYEAFVALRPLAKRLDLPLPSLKISDAPMPDYFLRTPPVLKQLPQGLTPGPLKRHKSQGGYKAC